MGRAIKPAPRAANNKLTSKQETFAKLVATGLSQTDAYKKSYDCTNMQDGTIHGNASRLGNNERVAARINQLRAKQANISLHETDRLRQAALETMYCIAIDDAYKASDRLRAAELLGKVRGVRLFDDNVQPNQQLSSPAIKQLEHKIRSLLAPDNVTDVQVIEIIEVDESCPESSDDDLSATTPRDPIPPSGED